MFNYTDSKERESWKGGVALTVTKRAAACVIIKQRAKRKSKWGRRMALFPTF